MVALVKDGCRHPFADVAAAELGCLWGNRLDGRHLTQALPREDRVILSRRIRELEDAFEQHDESELHHHVAIMLQPFFRRPEPRTYCYVLRLQVPAPHWAAMGAIERVRRGELANPDFAPSPGRLRGMAWHLAQPYWSERKRLATILAARPPREEESREHRAQVATRIRLELQNAFASQALARVSCSDARGSCREQRISEKLLSLPEF